MISRRGFLGGAVAAAVAVTLPSIPVPYAAPHAVDVNKGDAFIPEMWAKESLKILEKNMVVSPLVHRDFTEDIYADAYVVASRSIADAIDKEILESIKREIL